MVLFQIGMRCSLVFRTFFNNSCSKPCFLLNIGHNSITGTIPTEVGGLNNVTALLTRKFYFDPGWCHHIVIDDLRLTHCFLRCMPSANNSITGTIPTELGAMEKLGFVFLGK